MTNLHIEDAAVACKERSPSETVAAAPRWGQRHWLCLALFVGMFFQFLQRSCINEAVVGEVGMADEFGWTEEERGLVMSGFFYGYSLGQIPAGWAASRFGGRPLLFLLGLATLCSMSISFVAPYGATAVLAVRVVFGICQSPMWASAMALLARWSPPTELATLMVAATMSLSCAYFAGFLLTAFVMDAVGWRYVFLCYGSLALLWLPMWYHYGWSSAAEHPRISDEERRLLGAGGEPVAASAARPTPWLAILRSGQVWVVFVAEAMGGFAGGIFFAFVPTYLHQQLGFGLREAGCFSALPQAFQLLLRMLSGPLADSLVRRGVSINRVRKGFCLVPALTSSLCALCLGLGAPGVVTSVVLVTVATGAEGPLVLGTPAAVIDMTPDYAGLLAGINCAAWALVMGASSTVVGLILDWGHCPKGGREQAVVTGDDEVACASAWKVAFGIAAVLFFAQGVVFALFGSSKRLRLSSAASGEGRETEALCAAE